jgi:hypothetical protein
MNTIFKYTLKPEIELELPENAELLSVGAQGDEAVLWARVDPDAPKVNRHFRVFGTGHPMPDDVELEYVGTIQFSHGACAGLVFHAFEVMETVH